jgi:hypothetical protein
MPREADESARSVRPPPELEGLFRELNRRAWMSLEQAQQFVDRRVTQYNDTPPTDLGGLAPNQAHLLLSDAWDGTGPLRIAEDLALSDFAEAKALAVVNGQRLLAWLAERGPLALTPAGYLPRRVVAELIERLEWAPGFIPDLREYSRVINELDVHPMHVNRVVLGLAKLLYRRKGRLGVTPLGRRLSDPERGGALAALMFRTHFRVFDLRYGTRGFGGEEFQVLLPLTLWRIARLEAGWHSTQQLSLAVSPPDLARRWGEEVPVPLAVMMRGRIFNALCDYGLLETDLDAWSLNSERFRRTDLFPRFLSWRLR